MPIIYRAAWCRVYVVDCCRSRLIVTEVIGGSRMTDDELVEHVREGA